MAYPLSIGTIAEITIQGVCNGQIVMSLFHYRMTSGSTISDGALALGSVLTDFNTQVWPAYRNCMPDNWEAITRSIQAITPTRYRAIKVDSTGLVGTLTSCQNQSAASAITKYTDLATRKGIGTLHLPCVPGAAMENGMLLLGYQTNMATLAATMDNTLTSTPTATWQPVVYSRSNPSTSPIIQGCAIQTTIRTARRRVVRRGI